TQMASQSLRLRAQEMLYQKQSRIDTTVSDLNRKANRYLVNADKHLSKMKNTFALALNENLKQAYTQVEKLEQKLELINPLKILEMGYTITHVNGKVVDKQSVNVGDELTTIGNNFELKSTVIKIPNE
ncbi:MAG: exodeoxyribonuclease VII large subunit, partial [Bacteroidia bacterium]